MSENGHRSLSGFTLTELLLAFAIMSFVLTGILSLFISCIFLNEANRNLGIATGHAQFILEDVKNTDFNNFKTGSINASTYWDWNVAALATKGLVALANESIDTQGVWIDETAQDRLNLTVTVSWKDRAVRNRSLSMQTLITEP